MKTQLNNKETYQDILNISFGATQMYADEEFEEYNSDEDMDKPRLT